MNKKWKESYQKVLEFKKREGKFPTETAKSEEIRKLGKWISSQKQILLKQYEGKELEEIPEKDREKVKLLRENGIEYVSVAEIWERRYQEILEFKNREGRFPINSSKNSKEVQKLANWLNRQKMKLLKQYEGKELEEIPEVDREKVKLLQEIGIEYESQDERWNSNYEKLLILKKEKGKLPSSMSEDIETRILGRWIVAQRQNLLKQYIGIELEEIPESDREKVKLLREIGVEYASQDERWNLNYRKAVKLKQGELNEKTNLKEIESWIEHQKERVLKQYIGKELAEIPEVDREKVELLRQIGIEYRSKEQKTKSDINNWNNILQLIIEFKERKGRFPRDREKDEESRKLGKWLGHQKQKILRPYIGKELAEIPEEHREKVKCLREIGVEYNPKNQKFEDIIEMSKRNQELSQLIEKAEQLEKEYTENIVKER